MPFTMTFEAPTSVLRHFLVVNKFYTKINEHDVDGTRECVTSDFRVFLAGESLGCHEFFALVKCFFSASPDFQLQYSSLAARGSDKTGTITAHRLLASGHHPGEAVQFGPYPPIAASGKYVETKPETNYLHFRGEKICRLARRGRQRGNDRPCSVCHRTGRVSCEDVLSEGRGG